MRFAILLSAVVAWASAEKHCQDLVEKHCSSVPVDSEFSCSSLFSGVHVVLNDLQDYAFQHLVNSFQYMLMSANFANYERQREGFAKLFKKLSDDTWEDSIDIVKYMTKRGGSFNFTTDGLQAVQNTVRVKTLELTEPESLSLALDMYKKLTHKAHEIHSKVTKRSHGNNDIHDADVISFIEEKFVKKHSDIIRELSGHSNDLMKLIKKSREDKKMTVNQIGLSVYLFDEYLQSLY